MTREQIVAVLAATQRAWNARDARALAAVHTDDCIVLSPIFGEVRGRAAIEQTYRDLFTAFSDWSVVGQDVIVDSPRVAQLVTVTGTHTSEMFGVPATHRRFEFQGVLIYEFRDGKIASERRLYDYTSLLIQVGVIKAKPAS